MSEQPYIFGRDWEEATPPVDVPCSIAVAFTITREDPDPAQWDAYWSIIANTPINACDMEVVENERDHWGEAALGKLAFEPGTWPVKVTYGVIAHVRYEVSGWEYPETDGYMEIVDVWVGYGDDPRHRRCPCCHQQVTDGWCETRIGASRNGKCTRNGLAVCR